MQNEKTTKHQSYLHRPIDKEWKWDFKCEFVNAELVMGLQVWTCVCIVMGSCITYFKYCSAFWIGISSYMCYYAHKCCLYHNLVFWGIIGMSGNLVLLWCSKMLTSLQKYRISFVHKLLDKIRDCRFLSNKFRVNPFLCGD